MSRTLFRSCGLVLLTLLFSARALAVELVVSNKPAELLLRAVAGPEVRITRLLPNGASPHQHALRPSDRLRLARADLVVWFGPRLEPWLARSLAAARRPALDLSAQPGLLWLPARNLAGQAVADQRDPHLWLHPANAAILTGAIATRLDRQPGGDGRSALRARLFTTRLQALARDAEQALAAKPQRAYVASHDAWQYLERAWRLDWRGTLALTPELKPGAGHVLELARALQAQPVGCLIAEPRYDARLARRVFGGRLPRIARLDEMLADAPATGEGYEQELRRWLGQVLTCL